MWNPISTQNNENFEQAALDLLFYTKYGWFPDMKAAYLENPRDFSWLGELDVRNWWIWVRYNFLRLSHNLILIFNYVYDNLSKRLR